MPMTMSPGRPKPLPVVRMPASQPAVGRRFQVWLARLLPVESQL